MAAFGLRLSRRVVSLLTFALAVVSTSSARAQPFRKVTAFDGTVKRANLLGTVDGKLLYATSTNISMERSSIWATDGTSPAVKIFESTRDDAITAGTTAFGVVGGAFLFSDGASLHATKGTPATTKKLADVRAANRQGQSFYVIDGQAYFSAPSPTAGRRDIWTSDGTAAGTRMVVSLAGTAAVDVWQPRFLKAGATVVFTHDDKVATTDDGLWTITPAGATRILAGNGFFGRASCGSFAFLDGVGPDFGRGLGRTDGTAIGTARVVEAPQDNLFSDGACAGGTFVVASRNKIHASGATGTSVVREEGVGGERPEGGTVGSGPYAYFVERLPLATPGKALWRTDGTPAGTLEVFRLLDAGEAAIIDISGVSAVVDGAGGIVASVYGASQGYVVSNGTVTGTSLVSDASFDRFGTERTSRGGKAYFWRQSLSNAGFEPWVTDGTAAGTKQLADLWPGPLGTAGDESRTGIYERDARFVELDGEIFTLANADDGDGFEIVALRVAPSSKPPPAGPAGPDGGADASSPGQGAAPTETPSVPVGAPPVPGPANDGGCAAGGVRAGHATVVSGLGVAAMMVVRRRQRRAG